MTAHHLDMLPAWAQWAPALAPWTVGLEEEVMLLDPADWTLVHGAEEVIAAAGSDLVGRLKPETHGCALELATAPHERVGSVVRELRTLRRDLSHVLDTLGLVAAGSGTHPTALAEDVVVGSGARQQLVYSTMRELARREPTFALHVHVGIGDPEAAMRAFNRMRAHVPLLLALAANSPFWRGRDSGLASARTPLFQGFPRVGLPRRFESYLEWAGTVDAMIRAGAFPEPTFLWWDLRLQPRIGTLELRIMDSQAHVDDVGALVALVQSLVRAEAGVERGLAPLALVHAPEVLEENRFLAARDGMDAQFIAPGAASRIPARELLGETLEALRPVARELGCEDHLARAEELSATPGWLRQRHAAARAGTPGGVAAHLHREFVAV